MTYVSMFGGMTMILPAGVVVCTSWPGGMMQQLMILPEGRQTKKFNLSLNARNRDSLLFVGINL